MGDQGAAMGDARRTIPTAAVGSVPYETTVWVDGAEHPARVIEQKVEENQEVLVTLRLKARVFPASRLAVETDRHGIRDVDLVEIREWGIIVRLTEVNGAARR